MTNKKEVKTLQRSRAELYCLDWCVQLFWPRVVMRKWLNITTQDSDFSADEDEDEDEVEEEEEENDDQGQQQQQQQHDTNNSNSQGHSLSLSLYSLFLELYFES